MKKKIEFLCSCGNNQFKTIRPKLSGLRPMPSNIINSSETMICSKCGAKQSYQKLEKDVISSVKKQVEIDLKKMFKKAGFK